MVGSAETAVPFLAEQLKPVKGPTQEQLDRIIRALTSDSPKERLAAIAEMKALAEIAIEPLTKLQESTELKADARRQVDALLKEIRAQPLSAKKLQSLRANEVLERIGSAEAKKVLAKIAAGDPAARETEDAKEALKRLERRDKADEKK